MNRKELTKTFTVECYYSIGPHVDADGPELDRQSVLQVYPPHVLTMLDIAIKT